MGGWKRTADTVYAVWWPEHDVVKVGSSYRQRWRRFVLRGGVLIARVEYPNSTLCYDTETDTQMYLEKFFDNPFIYSPEDAIPLLGDTGGYLECFKVERDRMYLCSRIMRLHMRTHCGIALLMPNAPALQSVMP